MFRVTLTPTTACSKLITPLLLPLTTQFFRLLKCSAHYADRLSLLLRLSLKTYHRRNEPISRVVTTTRSLTLISWGHKTLPYPQISVEVLTSTPVISV